MTNIKPIQTHLFVVYKTAGMRRRMGLLLTLGLLSDPGNTRIVLREKVLTLKHYDPEFY